MAGASLGKGQDMWKPPQIFVEHHDDGWAVQELDAPLAAMRFRDKGVAETVARCEAARKGAELIVLDSHGGIERWESVRRRPASRRGRMPRLSRLPVG
jgi:hypothetical protein